MCYFLFIKYFKVLKNIKETDENSNKKERQKDASLKQFTKI